MADRIRVNDNTYSWGSIYFKVDDERFYGFTEITYGDKRERAKAYGMGRHHAPRGRTAGKYIPDVVKIKGHRASFQALRDKLAAQASDGKSYGSVEFQGLVQYIEPGDGEMTVELDRLVWTSESSTDTESSDPLMEEAEFDVMLIRRNGLSLYDQSEGEP